MLNEDLIIGETGYGVYVNSLNYLYTFSINLNFFSNTNFFEKIKCKMVHIFHMFYDVHNVSIKVQHS